MLVASADQ